MTDHSLAYRLDMQQPLGPLSSTFNGTGNECSAVRKITVGMLALLTGVDRFADDIASMIGFRPGVYWRICWKFIAPCFLLVIAAACCHIVYSAVVGKLKLNVSIR